MPQTHPPVIELNLNTRSYGAPTDRYAYRLGGLILASDAPVSLLDGFGIDAPDTASPGDGQDKPDVRESEGVCRSVPGWLVDRSREVSCWSGQAGYVLEIEGIGRFTVNPDATRITVETREAGVTRAALEESLLGPPVAFALAAHGAWCLHAGAVRDDSAVTLFAGESGQGKSTLASSMERFGDGNIRRTADDIIPCSLGSDRVIAHPHFPQLKLDRDAQYPVDAAMALPVSSVVILDPGGTGRKACLHPVEPVDAVKALAAHTVAVRLFDRGLHVHHLQFLAGLARSVSVYRLTYAHDYKQLEGLCRFLLQQLQIHSRQDRIGTQHRA